MIKIKNNQNIFNNSMIKNMKQNIIILENYYNMVMNNYGVAV